MPTAERPLQTNQKRTPCQFSVERTQQEQAGKGGGKGREPTITIASFAQRKGIIKYKMALFAEKVAYSRTMKITLYFVLAE